MADDKKGRGRGRAKGGAPPVVRRRSEDRKPMPRDLEAFAAGDDDALWRRPAPRNRLDDPRPVVLIPGVANRDARTLYEVRRRRILDALAVGDRALAALELAESVKMQIWRAHRVVGQAVFIEEVLGLSAEEGARLLEEGAAITGGLDSPPEEEIALWVRAEVGLVEADPRATVRLVDDAEGPRLRLEVAIAAAPRGLSAVGRRATPLAKEQERPSPEPVVDRPRGVAPLSRIIERERGSDD